MINIRFLTLHNLSLSLSSRLFLPVSLFLIHPRAFESIHRKSAFIEIIFSLTFVLIHIYYITIRSRIVTSKLSWFLRKWRKKNERKTGYFHRYLYVHRKIPHKLSMQWVWSRCIQAVMEWFHRRMREESENWLTKYDESRVTEWESES